MAANRHQRGKEIERAALLLMGKKVRVNGGQYIGIFQGIFSAFSRYGYIQLTDGVCGRRSFEKEHIGITFVQKIELEPEPWTRATI